jgi:cytochrome c peroxidase
MKTITLKYFRRTLLASSVLLACSSWTPSFAEPSIDVSLDKTRYQLGSESINLSVAAANPDRRSSEVDVHIGFVGPNGTFFAFYDWNTTYTPWLPNTKLPSGFKYPNNSFGEFNPKALGMTAGNWLAAAAFTKVGTLDIIALDTQAFEVLAEDTIPTDNTTPDVPVDNSNNILNLPSTLFDYTVELPAHFLNAATMPMNNSAPIESDNTPSDNPTTDAGATLGRVLFYDKNLSQNRSVSCASCHKQSEGFSDSSTLSQGFDGGLTGRHSMGLGNARFNQRGHFFWDERADTLEDQVLMPIQDGVEMGLTLDELLQRVEEQTYYPALFTAAFGDATVTTDRISKALAQFVRSLVSFQSKYDQGRAQVSSNMFNFPNFTEEENRGKNLFVRPIHAGGGSCFSCHTTDAFIDAPRAPFNNGLDLDSSADQGVGAVTGNQRDNGKFRVPSLRNIAVTAPYMHDGRLSSLEDVINHYNSGIQGHVNLSPPLRNADGTPVQMNLSDADKAALIAFLNTLTDDSFLTDARFSNPFVQP